MLSVAVLNELNRYVDEHFAPPAARKESARPAFFPVGDEMTIEPAEDFFFPSEKCRAEESIEAPASSLAGFVESHRDPRTFSGRLLALIDKSGKTDAEIYRAAGLDRRHFSKIRSQPGYRPKKQTATALALALRLSRAELDELLALCGYALSRSDTADLVVMFCVERGIYDLLEVNEALDYLGQPPLTN